MSMLNKNTAGKVGVLYGGDSAEREVSLDSGIAVYQSLVNQGFTAELIDLQDNAIDSIRQANIDLAFIAVHGGAGEDGRLQALLEYMDVPYTGSGVRACAVSMDKLMTKQLWQGVGLPTADFAVITADTPLAEVIRQLGRVMVKPAQEGSSIGMSIANNSEELQAAFTKAVEFDDCIIAEKLIDGGEYTVAIVNGEVLPPVSLATQNEFYDYQAKYQSSDTRYTCPCGLAVDKEAELKQLAKRAFDASQCHGWGRVDVMADQSGQFYLLEVNTVPGMTSHSLVPMAAKAHGWDFDTLIANIISGVKVKNA